MSIYTGPVFEMARRQFDASADHLEIPLDERDRIFYPKRAIAVSCPIHRDDGSTTVFQGYRVQHHLTLGPTKGGTRFSASLDIGEVAALAIWMSWKCALAGLPYGGAKGGVAVEPASLSRRELEALSRRYMQEMIPFVGPHTDIMAPDMGTNEQIMAWFMDTYSVHQGHMVTEIVTGKPVAAGGTEGRRDATGNGIAHLVQRAFEHRGESPAGRTAIVQGYGNVGAVAARQLQARGLRVIGIADRSSAYYDPRGIDLDAADRCMQAQGTLAGFARDSVLSADEFLVQPCDVLVPAAIERVITADNAARLRCRMLAEGANGPTTPEADRILDQRGDEIFVIPDILANSGGVIVSYFEWVQDLQQLFWDADEVNRRLFAILDRAFHQVTDRARQRRISHRAAALSIGIEKVRDGKRVRGLFP